MSDPEDVGKTEFACGECEQVFDSSKSLRTHVAQHKWGPHRVLHDSQGTRFQCLFEGCGKTVKDRKVLRKHCLTHKPREFECDECGKRFYERAKLKRHMLVHTGEKEFTCTFDNCDKRFAYKANLLTHMRIHTGHRPYKCTWPGCGKSFAQASNRNSHVLTHSQGKRKRTHSREDHVQVDEEDVKRSDEKIRKTTKPDGKKRKRTEHLANGALSPESPTSQTFEMNIDGNRNMTISPSHRDAMAVKAMLSLGKDHTLDEKGGMQEFSLFNRVFPTTPSSSTPPVGTAALFGVGSDVASLGKFQQTSSQSPLHGSTSPPSIQMSGFPRNAILASLHSPLLLQALMSANVSTFDHVTK